MTSASTSFKPAAPQGDEPPRREPPRGDSPRSRQESHPLPTRQPPLTDKCWLHREQPVAGQPYVIISQQALQQMDAHGRSNLRSELGGALLGQAYRYEDKTFVEIRAALPAVSPDHGPVHFTFNADTWTQLQRDRAAQHPNLDIVGWFHTHPDLGVFYSSDDVVVHSAAFTLPWHVGIVIDPVIREMGVFGWINGQLAPFSGCHELLDQQPQPLMPWKVVRTAVWYDGAAEHEAEAPGHVYAPAGQGVAVLGVAPRTALIASLLAMLLTVVLAVGWLLPLTARVSRLETVALTLANQALADGNALACPDARVRILTPLTNTAVSAGTPVRIIGSAAVPDAARYRVELRPVGAETWALLRTQRQSTSLDQLALWDTADYLPGVYELRLTAVDRNNVRLSQTDLCLINLELLP